MLIQTGRSPLGPEKYYFKTNGTIPLGPENYYVKTNGTIPLGPENYYFLTNGTIPLGHENYYVKTNGTIPPRPGARKDLINILSQKNTKEELIFLKKLIRYDILQIGTSPFNVLDSLKFTQSPVWNVVFPVNSIIPFDVSLKCKVFKEWREVPLNVRFCKVVKFWYFFSYYSINIVLNI